MYRVKSPPRIAHITISLQQTANLGILTIANAGVHFVPIMFLFLVIHEYTLYVVNVIHVHVHVHVQSCTCMYFYIHALGICE